MLGHEVVAFASLGRSTASVVPASHETLTGLGRAGWVTVPFTPKHPPLGVLADLVEESYRLVAPKRLVARLEELATGRRA